ncbi:hypothetical protein FDK21_11875 [Cohaesibacter sp. CAU 1516]|uniref:hypothetical protein n=1 Tax=Cohaesibacter sp. CAU 1516 TaxID=2576038 RepID=UPI0010FD4690|nr:hypothetical protein [Cohaesibacter sp. CAU 1516]TLP45454.1 hypothetical protein FDK21_11875 [Cohaesibacter sp. CAU 1516]
MVLVRTILVSCLTGLLCLPLTAEAAESLRLNRIGTAPAAVVPVGPALSESERRAHGDPLPDGRVAKANGDIRAVWLSQPTDRYRHGVLGDAIEAGAVTVRRKDGMLVSFVLPGDSVFEDLHPRLADLDGDGRTEIVLVRSYLTKGAALSILGLRNGKLEILAENTAIGTANRWLNPSILLDAPDTGEVRVGLVRTPHIGGQLQIWRYAGGTFRRIAVAEGFSNHTIGSRALGLSAVLSKGKARRILLPDARQRRLLLLDGDQLTILAFVPLPARPVRDFGVQRDTSGHQSVMLVLADGQLYQLDDPSGHWFD